MGIAMERRGARKDVLAFYQELPFNYRADAAAHAAEIRRSDPLQSYPPLVDVLKRRPRLLDVGCGAGWLVNSAVYHHRCPAHGLDFNPGVIERAKDVARELGVDSRFEVGDLFNYRPAQRFPLVTSIGVLHSTDECLGALTHIAESIVDADGRMFIGLYHAHARRPFLSHFAKLKSEGADLDKLYEEFCRLRSEGAGPPQDEIYMRSWFRDQVLHPHETQHTLAEILPLLDDLGFELESTSINRFAPMVERSRLIEEEEKLEESAALALEQGRFVPGFFVFMARRRQPRQPR
jgi:SAM-dependent methyltransferase